MTTNELQKTLARALDGDDKAQSKLTSLMVRSDRSMWETIIKQCAMCTLEAAELAKLPDTISNSECLGVAPFVRVVKSETVQKRIAKKFKAFIYSL